MDFEVQIVKQKLVFLLGNPMVSSVFLPMPSLTLSLKNIGARKSNEEMCVDRPFFNGKHHEHEYLEPFPYKSYYNDNLAVCCISYLSNLHHMGQSQAMIFDDRRE